MTTKCAVRNKFFHYKRPSKCWQTYLLNLQTFCFLNRSDQCNTLSRLSHTNNIYLLYILPNSCNINSWSPAKPLTDCKPHIIKKKACLGERKSIQPVKPARIVETEHFGLGRSDPTLTWLTVGNQCSRTTIDCTRACGVYPLQQADEKHYSYFHHFWCHSQEDYFYKSYMHSPGLIIAVQTNHLPSVLWRFWLGGTKDIRPVKNWVVGCWHGYLSGVRCRLAYDPADATDTHCLLLQ